MSQPFDPLAVARAVQQNFATMTEAELGELIADDCVVHEAPSLPFGGDWVGPSGFVALMRAIMGTFLEFSVEPGSIFTDSKDMLAFQCTLRGRTAKGSFEMPLVEYWRFADGKVQEIHAMWQDSKQVCDLL